MQITEERIRHLAGLSKQKIRLWRRERLEEGVDWESRESGEIVYQKSGCDRFIADYKLRRGSAWQYIRQARVRPVARAATLGAKGGRRRSDGAVAEEGRRGFYRVDGGDLETVAVVMTAAERFQGRWLDARLPDGKEARVRVKDSRLFTPGMEIEVTQNRKAKAHVWNLKGRHPRVRGRW